MSPHDLLSLPCNAHLHKRRLCSTAGAATSDSAFATTATVADANAVAAASATLGPLTASS